MNDADQGGLCRADDQLCSAILVAKMWILKCLLEQNLDRYSFLALLEKFSLISFHCVCTCVKARQKHCPSGGARSLPLWHATSGKHFGALFARP